MKVPVPGLLPLLLFLPLTRSQECYDDGNEFCIDENDILAADLLPGSFLFLTDFAKQRDPIETSPGDLGGNVSEVRNASERRFDGSFDTALYQMEFHRKRMNEYLCHGFMAEEILRGIGAPQRKKRRPEISAYDYIPKEDPIDDDNVTIHDKLLADEGSSKYKDWLQRTTTLDDIYRHYAPRKRFRKKQGVVEGIDDFDGEVTGYAVQRPLSSPVGRGEHYYEPSDDHVISSASSGHGSISYDHPPSHAYYPAPVHQEEHIVVPHYPEVAEEEYHHHHKPSYHGKGKGGHDLSITDFFEVALTALAFLAFGLFIINLMMNVTNGTTATTPTLVAANRRSKRYVPTPLSYTGNEELNELSHRVLRSIEAALISEQDGGNCLRRLLCEDNRQSKEARSGRRIWVPVWSLGMSWVSGRTIKGDRWSAMLESVRAAVMGLADADCAAIYPQCELEMLRNERRRRRRRRRK